jgi:hypothetical protein
MASWIKRNIFLSLGVAPPYASRLRLPPRDPRNGRFRRRKQDPYMGYHDRMSGNYCMSHNKIVDPL